MNAKEARENALDFYFRAIYEDHDLKKRLEEINGIINQQSKNGETAVTFESDRVPSAIEDYLTLSGFYVYHTGERKTVITWSE